MTRLVSSIDISPQIWNEHFIIGKLDEAKQFISYNEWFQRYIEKNGILFETNAIEQLFVPYHQNKYQRIAWTVVWDAIHNNRYWSGWLLSNRKPSLAAMEVKFIYYEDCERSHYLMIGQDHSVQYQHNVENIKQLRHLEQVNEAFDEASIIAITDDKGVISYVNQKFCETSKYSREELIGRTHRIINAKHHSKQFFTTMWSTIKSGNVWRGEMKNRAKDGSYYWMNTTIVPYIDQQGKPYRYISLRTDITDRIAAETELAKVLQQDFRRTIKSLQNCVFKLVRDDNNEAIFILSEGKLAEQLQMTTAQIEYMKLNEVWQQQDGLLEQYIAQAFEGETNHFELQLGQNYYYVSLSPVTEELNVIEIVGSMIDITERKKAEDTIHYMAHYDALTNLPNRTSFNRNLNEAIERAERNTTEVAVVFMDLDRFKAVNDTMGHTIGDQLLKYVADLLVNNLPNNVYISRQGGDEFTFFAEQAGAEAVQIIAEIILRIMSEPIIINNVELFVTPSIGISMYPKNGETADKLLKNADAAMYAAKDGGKNNYQFFTEELHQAIISRTELELDLRRAIEKEELELWYQPKVSLKNSSLIGMEALLRWRHPRRGLITPKEFMHIAEESNLIVAIGEWVLYEACHQMKAWEEQGYSTLQVAVNISLKQFANIDFPELIAKVLAETKLDAKYLELEITESVAQNSQHTIECLLEIKQLGVSISIDDFGTGYSSLSHLSQFPIDRLKIDQSFVRNLNERNQAIIRTIIDMASNMGIVAIAEGVETILQVEFLKQLNCQEAQGYFYSQPLSRLAALAYIERWKQSLTI